MSDYVTLKELADILGLDRSNARKLVLKYGFTPLRLRTKESGNQVSLALTKEDADRLLEIRNAQGFSATPKPMNDDAGYFYVIQLIPEYNPNRVKLGFAVDVQARFQTHRTSAPTAVLLGFWPCRFTWEKAAIASITRIESANLVNEVYECENIERLLERVQTFFALMPLH